MNYLYLKVIARYEAICILPKHELSGYLHCETTFPTIASEPCCLAKQSIVILYCESLAGDSPEKKMYGGTPVFGVDKPVIVDHVISTSKALKNMILLTAKMIETKLLEKMKEKFVTE